MAKAATKKPTNGCARSSTRSPAASTRRAGAEGAEEAGDAEDCVAACYDCLLSYYNQRDHEPLDRQSVKDLLLEWTKGSVVASGPGGDRWSEGAGAGS